jgi:cytochrome bd-type quinol oxidase subunit 2
VGALDWFTVAIAVEATMVLALHASLWLEWRTDEQVAERAGALGRVLFWGALGGAIGVTALALALQPRLLAGLHARPWVLLCALPASAIVLVPWLRQRGKLGAAFLASSSHIAGLLLAASSSLYPWMLPGTTLGTGWTAQTARSSPYSLEVGLYWWLPALCLVLACQAYVYRRLPDKFRVRDDAPY